MKLLPTPDLQIKESTLKILRDVLAMAETGEVTEVTIHYRKADGGNWIAQSNSMNVHESAGWLLDLAIERLK